jgi:hypothetical protein
MNKPNGYGCETGSWILGLILIVLLIILALIYYRNRYSNSERFEDLFSDPRYEKNRTLLYGSLFLDNLDQQIKNMTDPAIQYDDKRIEIIRYNDVLL